MGAVLALVLSLGTGRAETPKVSVTAEPIEVVTLYQEAATEAGLEGTARLPACRKWSAEFFMCFMVEESGHRRMVHLGDLAVWSMTIAELEALARLNGRAVLEPDRARKVQVEGLTGAYWVFDRGDGYDASILFYASELEALLGGAPVLAVPQRGLVIAWVPGNLELDQVVGVGVKRIHEQSEQPISPVIVHWNEERWVRWGEARAKP